MEVIKEMCPYFIVSMAQPRPLLGFFGVHMSYVIMEEESDSSVRMKVKLSRVPFFKQVLSDTVVRD